MQSVPAHGSSSQIIISMQQADELYVGHAPGRFQPEGLVANDWDATGAVLGEPGIARALRMLNANRRATELIIRVHAPKHDCLRTDPILEGLRAWCRAKVKVNHEQARLSRKIGVKMLICCTGLLALMLVISWALLHEDWFGPAGPIRTLASEAIVIAGWVAMWRPFEMVLFDPLRPRYESRLLESLLRLRWQVQEVPPSTEVARGPATS